MAPKPIPLLLLDANVVLELHVIKAWSDVLRRCDVTLARSVQMEAQFTEEEGERRYLDLEEDAKCGRLCVIEVPIKIVQLFRAKFKPTFMERMDPGELESLAHLVEVDRSCKISSADKIVWRTIGALGLGECGCSLEEILQQVGLSRPVADPFSKEYREHWTSHGFAERLQGQALRQ